MKLKAVSIVTLIVLLYSVAAHAQNPANWTPEQVLEPEQLATIIKENKNVPLIISVGPGSVIPHSYKAGMASQAEGINALGAKLDSLPKDAKILIYCGCCPFEHCPNVRPAIQMLKEKGFTNYYLLDLPINIKTDWISKGYPVKE